MRILVIRPEKLGDLVVATPVFRAIKATYPDCALSVLTDQVYGDILRDDPHVDNVIQIHWKWRNHGQHQSLLSIVKKIRDCGKFDKALILYANWSGWNLVCFLSGIPTVYQIGGTLLALLFGHGIVRRQATARQLHYRDYYLEVAHRIGAVLPDHDAAEPKAYLSEVDILAFAQRWPKKQAKWRVVIHPFGHGSSPNFSQQAYRQLIELLSLNGDLEIWLTGGKRDLKNWAPIPSAKVHSDWMGELDLRSLMAAFCSSDILVSGSTGVIHLAAALGLPTVGVFCPHIGSHPKSWGPIGDHAINLIVPEKGCRRIHPEANSACTGTMTCDLSCGISVETVAAQVLLQLSLKISI